LKTHLAIRQGKQAKRSFRLKVNLR